jgi:hypothetical protein
MLMSCFNPTRHRMSRDIHPRRSLFRYARFVVILVLLAFAAIPEGRASDIKLSTNELGRLLNVSSSVRALSKQGASSLRDQAWLSFMTELYKRQPAIPHSDITSAYSAYTNLFALASTAVNFQNIYANPSSAEIYNIINESTAGFTNLAPYVPFALSAVHFAAVTLSQSNGLQSVLVDTLQSAANSLQGLNLSGIAQLDNVSLSPNNLHNLIDSSISVALQNPEFNEAYTSIISPITGILPADSLSGILQKLPNLTNDPTVSAILSAIQSDNFLHLDTNVLLNIFSSQVNNLGQAVNTVMNNVGSAINGEIDAVTSAFNSQLFSEIDNIQSALSPLNDGDLIGSSVCAFDLLGSIAGSLDPNLGNQIATVGNAVTTVANTVSTVMDIADVAGSVLGAFDGIGAVMDVASLFGGGLGSLFGGGGDSQAVQLDQQILSAIGQLQNQIQNLQQNMDHRFDQVDHEINQVYTQMINGFRTLNIDFLNLQGSLNQDFSQIRSDDITILQSLVEQQTTFTILDQQLYAALAADALHDLVYSMNRSLGWQAAHGTPLPLLFFQEDEPQFLTYAVYDSTADQFSQNKAFAQDIETQLGTNGLDYQLNYLDWFVRTKLSLPSINPDPTVNLANPTIWSVATKAISQLAYENPAYFTTYQSDLSSVLSVGSQLEHAINNLTCTNLSSGGINWPLWEALFFQYTNAIPALASAITNTEVQYASSLGLPFIDFIDESQFLELVAGSPSPPGGFSINVPATGVGTNAVMNAPYLVFANSDGSVSGFDSSTNGIYFCNVAFDGSVRYFGPVTNNFRFAAGPNNYVAAVPPSGQQVLIAGLFGFVPIAGNAAISGFEDGQGTNALIGSIAGLCFNRSGEIFFLDLTNNAVRVVETNGAVRTVITNWPVVSQYAPILAGADNQEGVYLQFLLTNSSQLLVRASSAGFQSLISVPPVIINLGTTNALLVTNYAALRLQVYCRPSGEVWIATNEFNADAQGIAQSDIPIGESIGILQTNPVAGSLGTIGEQYSIPFAPISGFSGYSGHIGGSATLPGFSPIAIDDSQNVWLSLPGGVLRIGGSPYHTVGFLTNMQAVLQEAGPLNSTAHNLTGCKLMLQDVIQLGLSQSYISDDLMRSSFNLGGPNNMVDADALNLFAESTPILSNSANGPVLPDIISSGYKAAAILQRQVYTHLQAIQSRAQLLSNGVVADIVISNNAPLDISLLPVTVGQLPFTDFSNSFASNSTLGYLEGNNALPFSQLVHGLDLGHPTNLLFSSSNDFSVSFWATFPDKDSGVLVGSTNTGAPGWSFMLASNGLSGWWSTSDGTNVTFSFASSNDVAALDHCVVVFSAKAGVVRGYLNGSLVGQMPLPADDSGLGTNDLFVGGFTGLSDPIRTAIGEVAIWNRALASSDVAKLYASATANFKPVLSVSKVTPANTFPTEPLSIVHSTVNDIKLLQKVASLAAPAPRISATASKSNMVVAVYGQPGLYYSLQSSADLLNWHTYTSNVLEGSATAIPTQSPRLFLRAVIP